MKFLVYSRQLIESIDPFDVPHLFISIRTPGDKHEVKLPVNELTKGVLRLEFHDLDRMPTQPIPLLLLGVEEKSEYERSCMDPDNLFNEKHARKILEFMAPFVEQHDHLLGLREAPTLHPDERAYLMQHGAEAVQVVAVHCDAGWSRSPAVAAALDKGLFANDDSHWFKSKTPNCLVYSTLLRVIFGDHVEEFDEHA